MRKIHVFFDEHNDDCSVEDYDPAIEQDPIASPVTIEISDELYESIHVVHKEYEHYQDAWAQVVEHLRMLAALQEMR